MVSRRFCNRWSHRIMVVLFMLGLLFRVSPSFIWYKSLRNSRELHPIIPSIRSANPLYQYYPESQKLMCLQLLIGRVKYTSCGHIMNLEHVPIPCDSTTCVTSPNHSWVRRLGTRHSLGCNACTADLACLDHTPVRQYIKLQKCLRRLLWAIALRAHLNGDDMLRHYAPPHHQFHSPGDGISK